MPHGHGLVQQQLTIDNIALGSLAARNALILNTQFATPTNSFLAKRIRFFAQIVGRTAADDGPILIGACHGDADVSEIASAMNERNVNGPDDITSMLDQDLVWIVYQNTIVTIEMKAALTEGQTPTSWLKFGGKNGIPLQEGSGMALFAYNAGVGPLATGITVNGIAQVQGVWLRD